MGTNFYLFNRRVERDLGLEGQHIGKRSCGWVFHFQAYPELNVRTVEDWRTLTKTGFIYDEYGVEYTYNEFWLLVKETKKAYNDRAPYVLSDPNNELLDKFAEEESWEDEGFAFSSWEFC